MHDIVVLQAMEEPTGPLTHKQATQQLLMTGKNMMDSYSQKHGHVFEYLLKPHVMISLLFGFVLMIEYIYDRLVVLVEGLLLVVVVFFNGVIYVREERLVAVEMKRRLEYIIQSIETHGILDEDIKYTTNVPTIAITQVIRDKKAIVVPNNLLVAGDIVILGYGDRVPAKIAYLSNPSKTLDRDDILKPGFFDRVEFVEPKVIDEYLPGMYHFKVTETPLKHIMTCMLNAKRPTTVIKQHLKMIEDLFNTRILWILLGLSLGINLLRLFISGIHNYTPSMLYDTLARLQILVVLPMLPVSLPSLMLIANSYGNAYVLTLFDALQSSKTEFEDNEDVDEFDAAPAPTKDFSLSWTSIIKKFLNQVVRVDGTQAARMRGLIESLSNTTVICSVDREGTIAAPMPAIDQMFLLGEKGHPIVLDVQYDPECTNGVRFEDNDWNTHLKMLKPFGLSTILMTDCGIINGVKRNDLHFKFERQPTYGAVPATRQTCLCQLGRAIEFTEEQYKQFKRVMTVDTIATHHHSLAELEEYHYEIPSMTSAVITESMSTNEELFQIFSEGSIELILESCSDYWNGTGLGPMDETRRIFEFYQNAVIMDLEVVAFSYRPVQNAKFHSQIRKLIRPDPYFLNLPPNVPIISRVLEEPMSTSPVRQTPSESTPPQNEKKLKKRKYRDRMNSKLDSEDSTLGDIGIFTEITKGQTFLGAASFEYLPKPNMIDFVEDLALAGIRFVYFSRAPERESKAYAERLGLEIDWNSCIILSPDDGSGKGYLAIHDMKAQLPRGIENIRNHITNVDDVPLHVSLFAECKPHSIREMIKIFQEYGEVVCCIGSSLNDLNVESFGNADTSIAVDPIPFTRIKYSKGLHPLAVSASLNSSACALNLNHDASLYSITQMIREARSLAVNGKQAFAFYIGIQVALSSILLVSFCTFIPMIFTGYQMMFLLWITFPLLSLSMLFTPHLPDIMTHLPAKNAEHWKDVPRLLLYYAIRFAFIPTVSCVGLYWMSNWINVGYCSSWQNHP